VDTAVDFSTNCSWMSLVCEHYIAVTTTTTTTTTTITTATTTHKFTKTKLSVLKLELAHTCSSTFRINDIKSYTAFTGCVIMPCNTQRTDVMCHKQRNFRRLSLNVFIIKHHMKYEIIYM